MSGVNHRIRAVVSRDCGDEEAAYLAFAEAKAAGNAQSINVPKPSGTDEGDLLIAAVVTDGNESIDPTVPGDWTTISMASQDGVTLGAWWRIATASEPATHSFTWGSDEQCYAWMMRFTGHSPSNPIHASASSAGSSSSPSCPSVNTTIDNTLILRLGGFDDDDITVDAPGLGGHTTITMDKSNSGSGTCSGGAGYVDLATAGPSGTASFSLTGTQEHRSITVAIAPNSCDSGGGGEGTFEVRVAANSDDAEEDPGGDPKLNNSKLELGQMTWVAFRFAGVTVPQGAQITAAYVSMRAADSNTESTDLTVFGHDSDDAATFNTSSHNISSRPRTSASVTWHNVPNWSMNQYYQTPEIKDIIQEIVDRPGWASGNDLVILIRTDDDQGKRLVVPRDDSSTHAPLFHVEYSSGASGDDGTDYVVWWITVR